MSNVPTLKGQIACALNSTIAVLLLSCMLATGSAQTEAGAVSDEPWEASAPEGSSPESVIEPTGSRATVSSTPDVRCCRVPGRGPWSEDAPDDVAEFTGGIAARIHTLDGLRIAGDVFLLMATAGSTASALLFDQTAFTHHRGTAIDTLESNRLAVATIGAITGERLEMLEFTTAPGGGPSGGIAYAIAYLNIISDGAFTGSLRVAATGDLGLDGYVRPIDAINEKTAAAHLANANVLFTPSMPTDEVANTYGTRLAGELFRARNTGAALSDERLWENYQTWGTDRPNGMDIIGIRHIGDVAAYLCGAGSGYACGIVDTLSDRVGGGAKIMSDGRPAEGTTSGHG